MTYYKTTYNAYQSQYSSEDREMQKFLEAYMKFFQNGQLSDPRHQIIFQHKRNRDILTLLKPTNYNLADIAGTVKIKKTTLERIIRIFDNFGMKRV